MMASVALAAIGCSLVVDVDGLTGGALDGGGGTADGAVESSPESGPSGKPGDATDEGSPRGCARFADASFCQDFDEPTSALSPPTWNAYLPDGSVGDFSLVTDGAVSAPNAARATLTSSTSDCGFNQLTRSFPGSFGTLMTRASIRVESNGIVFAVVAAQAEGAGRSYRVLLTIESDGALGIAVQQYDSGNFTDVYSTINPLDEDPFARSVDLSVAITMAPSPSIVVTAGAKTFVIPGPADLSIKNPDIEIGQYCRAIAARYIYDDVAVWVGP